MNELKVLQLVTYVSADGAYGGPVGVAAAQSRSLCQLGASVELVAGWDGEGSIDAPDVAVRLFPTPRGRHGRFAFMVSPRLLLHVWSARNRFDVFHVHLARDLITMPAALLVLLCRKPLVIQTHGMIVKDARLSARLFDLVFTRRVLRKAALHLVLTETEQWDVGEVASSHRLALLPNGIDSRSDEALASFSHSAPEVVFCSRLHPRKRPTAFVAAAIEMRRRRGDVQFAIVGPDGGELEAVLEAIHEAGLDDVVQYEGPLHPALVRSRLAKADLLMLPSVHEPFPLVVLEAMSVGLPVVVTSSNGLAPTLGSIDPSLVTDGQPEQLAMACEGLLSDEERWAAAASAARELAATEFSSRAIAERLLRLYREAVEKR